MLERIFGKSKGHKRTLALIAFLIATVAKMVPELAGLATIAEQLGVGVGLVGITHAMTNEKQV